MRLQLVLKSGFPRRYRVLASGGVLIAFLSTLYWVSLRLFYGNMSLPDDNGPVVIDGTAYEGGGGLIRYAIAYSALLNQPVHIRAIRANRPGIGGLRPEHTVSISTMARLTSAEVSGNRAGSSDMTFRPHAVLKEDREPLPRELDITVEGSGSIFLIAMLPYLLFSHLAADSGSFRPSVDSENGLKLVIRAGTLCVKAPSIVYLRQVLLPTLELVGISQQNLRLDSEDEQGWHTENKKYPGKMVALIKPLSKPLPAFQLHRRGVVRCLHVTAHAPRHAKRRFEDIVRAHITEAIRLEDKQYDEELELVIDVFTSDPDDQYHLLIAARTEAPRAYLGYEQVYPQSDVFKDTLQGDVVRIATLLARTCIRGLWRELLRGNAVDEHTEDILILYQSLATGFSSVTARDNYKLVPEIDKTAALKFGTSASSHPEMGSGSEYGVETQSLHRETSWWMAEKMVGAKEETRTIEGMERTGCQGIGIGS